MCAAHFDSSFQQGFYKLFSFLAILLSWQSPRTLREAELSQSCTLGGVLT